VTDALQNSHSKFDLHGQGKDSAKNSEAMLRGPVDAAANRGSAIKPATPAIDPYYQPGSISSKSGL
jgi:hypothetical protein